MTTKFFKCAAVPVSKGAVSPLNKTAPWVEKRFIGDQTAKAGGGACGVTEEQNARKADFIYSRVGIFLLMQAVLIYATRS